MRVEIGQNGRVLKVELHCHTSDDPADYIPYSTPDLIDRAAHLGFDAIAVTLHDRYFDPGTQAQYAAQRGITLIAGIERTIEGKHVLLLNFPAACARVRSFADLGDLRRAHPRGLVVAPHPFYPNPSALKATLLRRHLDLFDALEINALWTPLANFNAKAFRWGRAYHKPLVGNSDLHLLGHLGRTFSLVDSDRDPDAICDAIRSGRVEVRTEPVTPLGAGWIFAQMLAYGLVGRARRTFAGSTSGR